MTWAIRIPSTKAVAAGFPQASEEATRDNATALLALLSGGVSIDRAARHPEASDAIACSIRCAAIAIGSANARGAFRESGPST